METTFWSRATESYDLHFQALPQKPLFFLSGAAHKGLGAKVAACCGPSRLEQSSMAKSDIAKAGSTDLAVASGAAAFEAFAGGGLENVGAKDILIPRLGILQGLSPQVTQGKPEYGDDNKVGDVFDLGLQERFPNGIVFIPVHYQKVFLEWAPRKSGEGLKNIHTDAAILDQCTKDESADGKGKMMLPNGNYISETSQLFGINVTAGNRKTLIAFTSTQLKKCRRILTLASGEKLQRADSSEFTPPLWYRQYALTTVPESNNEGNWMGWKIERGASITELPNWADLNAECIAFQKSLAAGELKADLSGLDGGGAAPNDGSDNDTKAM